MRHSMRWWPRPPTICASIMPPFDKLRSSQTKLRTYASFTYQAGSWTRPRKVVARLECSLQPDAGDSTTGMRQEVDIRYVVTSLRGTAQPARCWMESCAVHVTAGHNRTLRLGNGKAKRQREPHGLAASFVSTRPAREPA